MFNNCHAQCAPLLPHCKSAHLKCTTASTQSCLCNTSLPWKGSSDQRPAQDPKVAIICTCRSCHALVSRMASNVRANAPHNVQATSPYTKRAKSKKSKTKSRMETCQYAWSATTLFSKPCVCSKSSKSSSEGFVAWHHLQSTLQPLISLPAHVCPRPCPGQRPPQHLSPKDHLYTSIAIAVVRTVPKYRPHPLRRISRCDASTPHTRKGCREVTNGSCAVLARFPKAIGPLVSCPESQTGSNRACSHI